MSMKDLLDYAALNVVESHIREKGYGDRIRLARQARVIIWTRMTKGEQELTRGMYHPCAAMGFQEASRRYYLGLQLLLDVACP